jgi:hypothetical protein
MKELHCDFYGSTEIVCGFAGPETVVHFEGKEPANWHNMGDGWAACEECATLMEGGRLEDLANRAVDAPWNGMVPCSANQRAAYLFLLLTQYNKINPKREAA